MNDPLKIKFFIAKEGHEASVISEHGGMLDFDDRNTKQVYTHASYLHHVISCKVDNELLFVMNLDHRTIWLDDTVECTVSDEGDGSIYFRNSESTDEENDSLNRECREEFERLYASEIELAKSAVLGSTSEATRKRLREEHHAFATEVLGMKSPQLGLLYSYHGDIPYGKTWGKTDISHSRASEDVVKAGYYKAIESIQKHFGESRDSGGFWDTERYDSWASPFWVVAIQYFFREGLDYTLTPMAMHYIEEIYNRWQEWDVDVDEYL